MLRPKFKAQLQLGSNSRTFGLQPGKMVKTIERGLYNVETHGQLYYVLCFLLLLTTDFVEKSFDRKSGVAFCSTKRSLKDEATLAVFPNMQKHFTRLRTKPI